MYLDLNNDITVTTEMEIVIVLQLFFLVSFWLEKEGVYEGLEKEGVYEGLKWGPCLLQVV